MMQPPEGPIDALRQWFNEHQDKPRIIALMSPTCGFCLVGHQAVCTYHAWLPDAGFVTKRVWVPMMAADDQEQANLRAATTADPRITDMYDAQHALARLFRDVLDLAAAAWDTYMLYQPGTVWTDERPPQPDEHQYQLYPGYGPDQSRLFTPMAFWWHLVEAVGQDRAAYEAQVPPLASWLNADPAARIGLEVPARYL